MPNHVKNVVRIKNIPKDKIDYVLNKLAVKYTTPEYKGATEEYIMDFDLIIPEPRFISDCPKNCIVNKDSHVMEDKDRPWFDWYQFHTNYWGTKWNAYDGYTRIGKTQITFIFSTAWSIPGKIYEKLFTWCDDQGFDVEVKYADEDLGSNCGVITLDASEHKTIHQTEKVLENPTKHARYLWNNY